MIMMTENWLLTICNEEDRPMNEMKNDENINEWNESKWCGNINNSEIQLIIDGIDSWSQWLLFCYGWFCYNVKIDGWLMKRRMTDNERSQWKQWRRTNERRRNEVMSTLLLWPIIYYAGDWFLWPRKPDQF